MSRVLRPGMTRRALSCIAVAAVLAGGCSDDDSTSSDDSTIEDTRGSSEETTTASAASATSPVTEAQPTTTAATATETTEPATTITTTTSPADAEIDPQDLIAVLQELESAVEDGDAETAARLGGREAAARAWYRKLGAIFGEAWAPPAPPEVTGDLTIVEEDGDVIETAGEYSVAFPDEFVFTNEDPVFNRSDGEITFSSASPVSATGRDENTFRLEGVEGELVVSDNGMEVTPRTAQLQKTAEFVYADFVFSTDDAGDREALSAVWVDTIGNERVTALQMGVDDRTGDTVFVAAFDSMPLYQSLRDGLGSVTLHFTDGDSVTGVPLSFALTNRELDLLDAVPADDPSLDTEAETQELVDTLAAYGAAGAVCSGLPEQCNPEGPFGPKVVTAFESQAQFGLDENIRVRFPDGSSLHRVDEVRIHPGGISAVIATCQRDGAVQVDIGDPADPADDEVVNDEVASSTVLFVFDRIDGVWMLNEFARTFAHDDPDECATVEGQTVVPVVQPSAGGAGVDAEGLIEFRQTVLGFVQNTVITFGEQGTDPEAIASAVFQTYPSLTVSGSAVEATPSSISILSTFVDDKSVAGPDNPFLFAVAVRDTSGACLGGVVHGFPLPTEVTQFEDLASCNADAVREAFLTQQ